MAEGHATLPGERRRMGRPHLFAIDGDPDFLDLLRELFQDANYHVTTTNFVPGTFDQIAALGPALLLVDLVVYEQAGWELLARLRAASRTRGCAPHPARAASRWSSSPPIPACWRAPGPLPSATAATRSSRSRSTSRRWWTPFAPSSNRPEHALPTA